MSTVTVTRRSLHAVLLFLALWLALWLAWGAPAPTAAARPAPPPDTATPTWTPAPTQTARVIVVIATDAPTATSTPSPTPSPTPVLQSGAGGGAGSVCQAGEWAVPIPLPVIGGTACVPGKGFIGWIFGQAAGLFTGAVDAIVTGFQDVLTKDPNITDWADAKDLFTFCWGLGLGMAGTFYAVAGLYWIRNSGRRDFEPMVPLQDAILGGAWVGGLPWLVPQWLGWCNDLAYQINHHVGVLAMTGLDRLLSDMMRSLAGQPGYAVVDVLVSFLMFLFALLIGLVRFVGLYGMVWLYCVGPMALSTWIVPPLRGVAYRWLAAFASITLWGSGWAVAFKVFNAVGLDLPRSSPYFDSPLMIALAALSGLIFMAFVPRLVDLLIGTGIAAASGAYVLFEGVIGGVVGAVTAALTQKAKGKGI